MSASGIALLVSGKVQGVGFRAFIWRIAKRLALKGEVNNEGSGVKIKLLQPVDVPAFIKALHDECPPLAHVEQVTHKFHFWARPPRGFSIIRSEPNGIGAQIVQDIALCKNCTIEFNDSTNRRYHYPFICCDQCGPRFSMIKAMPYDRSNTAMNAFELCPTCKDEYHDSNNRRYRAQNISCPECGPAIWTSNAAMKRLREGEEALKQAVRVLLEGKIVAIKGAGGFYLACDATNEMATLRLRTHKQQPSKPFPVMLKDETALANLTSSQDLGALSRLLNSPAAPIAIVKSLPTSPLCPSVLQGIDTVGLMLPSNGLQHLLMQAIDRPLVMTSGNIAGQATIADNENAVKSLSKVADIWLLHNQEIVHAMDDSVVEFHNKNSRVLRRAWGYAPGVMSLPPGFNTKVPMLALGADKNNAVCLLHNGKAIIGQHFGDLSEAENVQEYWQHTLQKLTGIYDFDPQYIITDADSKYVTSQFGQAIHNELDILVTKVHHHHALLAACLAEHHWSHSAGQVIGLVLDGVMEGDHSELWGGECLLADYSQTLHLGGLPAVALPGGDLANEQPWRNLLAHFFQFVPKWQNRPEATELLVQDWEFLTSNIVKGEDSPQASSCARLFDAIAFALGCAPSKQSWEEESMTRLETLANTATACAHPVTMPLTGGARNTSLDLHVFWKQWLDFDASPATRAWVFHDVLAQGFATMAKHHAKQQGINTIALSGKVLQNRLFLHLLRAHLRPLDVFHSRLLPVGDASLALGQIIVVCAQLKPGNE